MWISVYTHWCVLVTYIFRVSDYITYLFEFFLISHIGVSFLKLIHIFVLSEPLYRICLTVWLYKIFVFSVSLLHLFVWVDGYIINKYCYHCVYLLYIIVCFTSAKEIVYHFLIISMCLPFVVFVSGYFTFIVFT